MSVNLPTLVLIILSFVIFMIVMKNVFFDPIYAVKRERERKLNDERERARSLARDLETLEKNYQSGLQDARKKAQQIIQEVRTQAKGQAQEKLDAAREESRTLLEKSMLELAQWRRETYEQLEPERQELAQHIINKFFPALEATGVR